MEFKVNEYIVLKLENDKTVMYVSGWEYDLCCGVLVRVSSSPPNISIENQVSIDAIIESKQYESTSNEGIRKVIGPEEEFWAFCSNLQVWVENDYNTDLLVYTASLPLLVALIDVGDPKAKVALKRETLRRLKHGNYWDYRFIMSEGIFLQANLSEEELIEGTLNQTEAQALKKIGKRTDLEYFLGESFEYGEVSGRPHGKNLCYPSLYFTVKNGHLIGLELELNEKHPTIPKELEFFTRLKKLHIWVTDLDMEVLQPSFTMDSVSEVTIIKHKSVYPLRFLGLIFPDLEYPCVYNGSDPIKPAKIYREK